MKAQTVNYTYDHAGNRISRKVITLPPPPQGAKQQSTDSTVVQDMMGERTITVYPNPTRGNLGVQITGGNTEEEIRLIIFGGQGVQLYNSNVQQGINTVDMTAYPKGWYILRVQAGEKRKEFKVIKE
ncbi:MAG: T9SS type A sorting domain-containing protein [Paludibacter sp.]|nr:T9SS type A sorting domain-containing protein [Paludibacter sp.]